MKYMLMCLFAMQVSFGIGGLLTGILKKTTNKLNFRFSALVGTLIFGVLILCGISLGYLNVYYHANAEALKALEDSAEVQVDQINKGYYFDGPGKDSAIIFYPGAKVEAEAYAPLLMKLAEEGVDCFLADMPFNMAILGSDTAQNFIEGYNYQQWYIAGHSMGGLVASSFANAHTDEITGTILLAAYPTENLNDSLEFLSIYGDQDQVLGQEVYEKSKSNWPENQTEYVIQGGNHGQFADYGQQNGDGEASISEEEQITITTEQILDFIGQKRGGLMNEHENAISNAASQKPVVTGKPFS